jgi:hypothetical protein
VSVQPPTPNPLVAEQCVHLNVSLPQRLDSLTPRVVSPATQFVHAWGDPAVVLSCGVGLPAGYSPRSSETTLVNHVQWYEQPGSDTVTWTAISRRTLADGEHVNVRLVVPTRYEGQGVFLVALAPALKATLP